MPLDISRFAIIQSELDPMAMVGRSYASITSVQRAVSYTPWALTLILSLKSQALNNWTALSIRLIAQLEK